MSERTLDELTLGERFEFEELIDRNGLAELARSFYDLFRVPLKMFSASGELVADAAPLPELYRYLSGLSKAKSVLADVVSAVKRIDPGLHDNVYYDCCTGAVYHVTCISYAGRRLGRLVLGPFIPPTVVDVPATLVNSDPDLDPVEAKRLLHLMPRARPETVAQIARHLRTTLDLSLFSGHKALLTSNLHLASVRESFRDLQEKNEKLQEAYDRLTELDRLKSNFLATVSHELRTPLTSIIGYSEMLQEGIAGPITEEQGQFVTTIHEKGEQLLELISGLLDLSKLESGTLSVRKEEVDVVALVKDVASTLAPSAQKRAIQLQTRYSATLPKLWADPTRLRQILLNLTDNAIKFTDEGGSVLIDVALSTLERDEATEEGEPIPLFSTPVSAVKFSISDTGVGIPDAAKIRVFDAFYQVDSSSTRAVGGTGLGLSIVKRLVEAHAGSVQVHDNQPRGSVFVVKIPCKHAA